ncbi:TetR/AcrR family transcriptional regulator [Neobacillus niacini]|uniref:TetR/AcrR family transcriptional regulator n=1 Tax=Neobacillus niacini TaxID=86668 RepID=UPI0028663576|nr:TetR/AcrR family transcriptional regulator [Neobacillus niacini]MDR6999622.1 AcrR family transcriptional regulator [Neobacillus niacini]
MEDLNRNRIIQAADELFNKRGYKSVTISDIAEKLGMSKKTIYQYFSGKEEIATSVIETVFRRISVQFDTLKQDDDHPIAELCASLEQVKTEVARLHPLFLEDIQKLLPDLWQKVEEFRAQRILQIESSIKEAQKMGAATDVDARLATVIFLETVQSLIRPDTLSRHGFTASEALGALIDIFIKGITQVPHK